MLSDIDHAKQGLIKGIRRIEFDQGSGNLCRLLYAFGAQLAEHQGGTGDRGAAFAFEYSLELGEALPSLAGVHLGNRNTRLDGRVFGIESCRLFELLEGQLRLARSHIGIPEHAQRRRIDRRLFDVWLEIVDRPVWRALL